MLRIKRLELKDILALMVCIIGIMIGGNFVSNYAQAFYRLFACIILFGLFLILVSEMLDCKGKSALVVFIVGMIFAGSIYALRAPIGNDDLAYAHIFNAVYDQSLPHYLRSMNIEKGYLLLNYILFHLTMGDYNLARMVISYLTIFFWGAGIWKLRDSYSITMMSFFFFSNYYAFMVADALVRIFLAAGIVFYGYCFLVEGKTFKYIVCVLLAAIFHISALFMLVLPIIMSGWEFIKKNMFVFLLILFGTLPIAMLLVARGIAPYLGARYQGYVSIASFSLSLGGLSQVPLLILGIVLLLVAREDSDNEYVLAVVLTAISCAIEFYGSMFKLGRLCYYTNIGTLMLAGKSGGIKCNKIWQIAIPAVYIAYGVFYMIYTVFFAEQRVMYLMNYKFFW